MIIFKLIKMDNVINKFFVGDINQFGFGAYNSQKPNYLKILRNYPYPSTENNSIDKYFQNQNNQKIPHQNYIPNAVNLPNINNNKTKVDLSKSMSMPLKPLYPEQYDYYNNYNYNIPKNVPAQNFSPPLIKMQVLEDRLNQMEKINREEFKKNMQNIENKYIGNGRFKQFLDTHRKDIEKIFQQNFNYENNLPEIPEDPIVERRNDVKDRINYLKRQIDYEKELIREKNKHKHKKRKKKKYYDDESYYESEDYLSDLYENPKFKERILDSTATSKFSKNSKTSKHITKKSPMSLYKETNTFNNSPKSILVKKSPRRIILNGNCVASNKILNQQEKLYEALNELNLAVNDFKIELDNKLELLDINQRNSFNKYQNILNDGNNDLKLSIRKIINKDNIEDEESERNNNYRDDLNQLIDEKIREYNRFREEEDLRKKLEDEEEEKRRLELISKIEMDRVYNYLTNKNNEYIIENLKPFQIKGKKLPIINPDRKEKTKNKTLSNNDNQIVHITLKDYEQINSNNRNDSKNRIVIHFDNKNNRDNNNNNIVNIKANTNINNEKEYKIKNENVINNNETNKNKNDDRNEIDNKNKEEKKDENKEENKEENKSKTKNPSINLNSEKEIVTLRTPRTILNYSEDDEEEYEGEGE